MLAYCQPTAQRKCPLQSLHFSLHAFSYTLYSSSHHLHLICKSVQYVQQQMSTQRTGMWLTPWLLQTIELCFVFCTFHKCFLVCVCLQDSWVFAFSSSTASKLVTCHINELRSFTATWAWRCTEGCTGVNSKLSCRLQQALHYPEQEVIVCHHHSWEDLETLTMNECADLSIALRDSIAVTQEGTASC